MLRPRFRWLAAGLGVLVAVAALGVAFAQQGPPAPGTPIAAGLSLPRGITAMPDGSVLVAEGAGGRILSVAADGTVTEIITDLPVMELEVSPGEVETVGVSAVISDGNDGYLFVVGESTEPGFSALYSTPAGGPATLLADLGAYEEANNTDGDVDLAGDPEFNSNPYDLVSDGAGGVYLTDAGANAVLHVDASNNITPFAIFPNRENPLFAGGNGIGGPTMDQVPTGITIGPDGAVYVATLTGFPFPTGAARVYRLEDGNADGDALDDGEATVFVEGLTTATDVAFDANGDLLVSQFSTDMLAGAPGRISRVSGGQVTTIVHLLVTPTSLTVTDDGRLLVTQEFAGLVSDVTDVLPGGFGTAPTPGATFSTYGGGPVAQLAAEAGAAGVISVVVTVDGSFVVLVIGAPDFVNVDFNAAFPGDIPAGTPLILVVAN